MARYSGAIADLASDQCPEADLSFLILSIYALVLMIDWTREQLRMIGA
jgi:hypothetical protein